MSDATEKQRRIANLMAVALWSELNQKARPSVLAAKLPKDAADVLRDLMLDALRQADLADALAAALRGAIGALEFSRDFHADLGNEDQAFAQDKLDAATAALAAYEGRK